MNLFKKIVYNILTIRPKTIKNNRAIAKDSSTILLKNCSIRFDTLQEDRIYVKIGNEGLISANFIFESGSGYIEIGDNVHIGGANIISRSSVKIGNDVTMAWDITIYDHNSHSIYWTERKGDNHQCFSDYLAYNGNNVMNKNWEVVSAKPILIEDKVWIGFGVTILKGVTIGEGAVIGAKSVVTKDVPAWSVVAGNPAKVVKNLPLGGNKISE